MIIVCDNCKTKFKLDDSVTDKLVFKARCSRCDHVFTASRESVGHKDEPVLLEQQEIPTPSFKIITVCNQKGGVAKTTTCVNLGNSLALGGKKVLLVDFDVQANLTTLAGVKGADSFFDVLERDISELPKFILKTGENVWVLPSNSRMALLSKRYIQKQDFEKILANSLAPVADFFDFIIIDTPPSIDFFTINALMASDMAIIPTQSEFLALNGVSHVGNIIDVIQERTGHTIDFRILVTMFEEGNIAAKVILNQLKSIYKEKVFSTIVEQDKKVQESQIVKRPILTYDSEAPSAKQYLSVAMELLGTS